jgi:GT2 family glycosyltransferase
MTLAVILVNWRNERRTAACARALKGWRTLAPKILVVDNESSAASRSALAGALAPDELICSPVNLGYGGGNNLGIARALEGGATYILLLNIDAEISEAAATGLIERLEMRPEISILGPVVQERHRGVVQTLAGGRDIARYRSTRVAARSRDRKSMPGYPLAQADYVSGTVLLARSQVFADVGLLDEQYFFSGEIADFCKRARDKGHSVCVDLEVEARHDADQTAPARRETLYAYYSLRNRLLYVRKHHAAQRRRYFVLWGVVGAGAIANALIRGNLRKARAIGLALAHGYAGRYGNRNASFM